MQYLDYLIVAAVAYLIGSIPTGYLVAKAKGIDIRSVGSGNIGATNAMRVLGKPIGIAVLLLDAAKGFGACFLGAIIYSFYFYRFNGLHSTSDAIPSPSQEGLEHITILAGICAVLGHNYTCWLKFKGGKGIATTAGVFLALAPWPLLIALIVFIVALLVTKYVSVGSMSAAVALPTAVWIMTPQNILLGIVATALGVLAIFKHKGNLQRLIAGTENRLGKKTSTAEGAK